MTVLGFLYGVDDWVKAQCLSKVGKQMKVQPYFHIITDDLQLALTLIRKCLQLKYIHLARTGLSLINGAAKLVDATMVQLVKVLSRIEGYPDEWPMISRTSITIPKTVMQLPEDNSALNLIALTPSYCFFSI